MHKLVVALVALTGIVACGHPQESPKQRSSGADCAAMATAIVKHLQAADQHAAGDAAREMLSNLKAVLANRCAEDRWSAAALACFGGASNDEQMRQCQYQHLTQEQKDKVERAVLPIMQSVGSRGDARADIEPRLRVTGVDPDKGDADGGTYVRIQGTRFTADGPRSAKVYFGARQGTVVRFASDRELIVEAPGGKPNETVDVLIIFDPGGQLKISNGFTFVEKH